MESGREGMQGQIVMKHGAVRVRRQPTGDAMPVEQRGDAGAPSRRFARRVDVHRRMNDPEPLGGNAAAIRDFLAHDHIRSPCRGEGEQIRDDVLGVQTGEDLLVHKGGALRPDPGA